MKLYINKEKESDPEYIDVKLTSLLWVIFVANFVLTGIFWGILIIIALIVNIATEVI